MNLAAKNLDHVQPQERIAPDRRERVPQFWPMVVAVLAFVCLAYENVSHRDAIVTLKEQHAAEIEAKDEQISRLSPAPAYVCREYVIAMEGRTITQCHRTVTKL